MSKLTKLVAYFVSIVCARRKKIKGQSLIIVAVLLAAFTLASCGIPQEDYDQVASDLAAAQAEIARLETDLATAHYENSSLQNELDAAVAEYEGLAT
jgi:outer membrane murein-binding lipoprotein Lpp